MGSEIQCSARWGKQQGTGKALLETNEILFRGDFRLKIPFAEITAIKAVNGELRVQWADGLAVFEIGEAAEKWRYKVLHPKTRMEKIGVRPGAKVSLVGKFEKEFLAELKALKEGARGGKTAASDETVFFAADAREELLRIAKTAKGMKGAASLWVVYPKGQKTITENDVIGAGRKAGLKDVKVVGFSGTHTALKFIIPLVDR